MAKFSDGNIYYNWMGLVGVQTTSAWRALPYPATPLFDATDLTMGAAADICDPLGSMAVWIASKPTTGTDQTEEQGS